MILGITGNGETGDLVGPTRDYPEPEPEDTKAQGVREPGD